VARPQALRHAAGKRETVSANDLFYWPPGHNVKVDADAEGVMFSPQRGHSNVINHMIEKTELARSLENASESRATAIKAASLAFP
jgi:hypothetical protein